eukprot:2100317-Heterocapsa_arctica.AAC.1
MLGCLGEMLDCLLAMKRWLIACSCAIRADGKYVPMPHLSMCAQHADVPTHLRVLNRGPGAYPRHPLDT